MAELPMGLGAVQDQPGHSLRTGLVWPGRGGTGRQTREDPDEGGLDMEWFRGFIWYYCGWTCLKWFLRADLARWRAVRALEAYTMAESIVMFVGGCLLALLTL